MDIIEILRQIFSATDEQTTAFSEAMKTNGLYTTTHENMDVRYPKMKSNYEETQKQLGEANKLIGDMKKSTKGQEELQGKITAYEGQVQQLMAELNQAKIESAVKIGLLTEGVEDIDYVTFKLNEKARTDGKPLELDENEKIKGWAELVDSLKTQLPAQFKTRDENHDGYEVYKPSGLRKPDHSDPTPTRESFKNMTFEQRAALNEKNPTLYKQLRGK